MDEYIRITLRLEALMAERWKMIAINQSRGMFSNSAVYSSAEMSENNAKIKALLDELEKTRAQ